MAALVVIATLDAKPGREADLERALEALVAPTHAEAGCRAYVLHRDDAVPGRFVFYERWDGEADLAAHFETPHLKAFLGMADDLLAKPLDVVKCTEIAGGA